MTAPKSIQDREPMTGQARPTARPNARRQRRELRDICHTIVRGLRMTGNAGDFCAQCLAGVNSHLQLRYAS